VLTTDTLMDTPDGRRHVAAQTNVFATAVAEAPGRGTDR
jgi:hypothetical protein